MANLGRAEQWAVSNPAKPRPFFKPSKHRVFLSLAWAGLSLAFLGSTACDLAPVKDGPTIVVDSLEDSAAPAGGAVTLRSALADIESGGTITFDAALNGGTIDLTIVGSEHSVLKGEVYVMNQGWQYLGFQDRDYGRSALYAAKDVTIDASGLPDGITLRWTGGDANRARVLAVYGDLTMMNVTVTSGFASAEPITGGTQPYTLGRGGGLAVWGTARLVNCTLSGNRAAGDLNGSRDRGSFGGGIYANRLDLEDCVVSGNRAIGYGAAGGGIYSVGGADDKSVRGSALVRCAVTGNRVTGQHAYGGGIFTEGGGRGNTKPLSIVSCTFARNLVEDHPDLAESPMAQYYYRGGGIYMSNGSLSVACSTIAENTITGIPAVFNNKPNMGGGGIASTIGDAHVVENMEFRHSIIAGNTVGGAAGDLFSGSLLHFISYGYNLLGHVNFDHILVPIPPWESLSRKHWPKAGDRDGIAAADALDLGGASLHPSIVSTGADEGLPAVLWYPPAGPAEDKIPTSHYISSYVLAEYKLLSSVPDDFLNRILEKLRNDYGDALGGDFGSGFGDLTGVTFYGPAAEWPSNPENAEWIGFWRALDAEIGDRLGTVKLGDGFWGSCISGPFGPNIQITVSQKRVSVRLADSDQLGTFRLSRPWGDIGAIEK